MGNKTDYPKINPEVVEKQELLNFAGQISAIAIEISAKNGYGLEQLFKLIQYELFGAIEDDDEQKKKKKEETKKKKKGGNKKCNGCCN